MTLSIVLVINHRGYFSSCLYVTSEVFLINSSADGHLSCFQILVIVNCAAMNIRVHIFFLVDVSDF